MSERLERSVRFSDSVPECFVSLVTGLLFMFVMNIATHFWLRSVVGELLVLEVIVAGSTNDYLCEESWTVCMTFSLCILCCSASSKSCDLSSSVPQI